jgi:hypothetical protein
MEVLAQAVMNHVEATAGAIPQQPEILGTMDVDEQLADFDCPVCWNSITEGEKKVKTSCNHTLCMDCAPKLQCLVGTTTCVSCPMCRTRLQKFTVPEVPLRKVPLHKIRQRLQRQNHIVAGYQHTIQNTPHLINYYMRIIQEAVVTEDRAQRELAAAMVHQEELQEEVNMRARPRRQPAVSAIV